MINQSSPAWKVCVLSRSTLPWKDLKHGEGFCKVPALSNLSQQCVVGKLAVTCVLLCSGLRLAIEAHGGHFWSTQGQVQRPLDIMSLRIDHGERMTLGLASALISPTHYMTAFLAQRGWTLPHERYHRLTEGSIFLSLQLCYHGCRAFSMRAVGS